MGMLDRMTYGPSEAVSDDPAALRDGVPDQVLRSIGEFVSGIESELTIVSAYFVPRQDLVDYFSGLTDRGIRVRVLTNSLASNNHAIASSQYKKWRKPLLAAGVELYEMRSDRLWTRGIDTPPVAARAHVLHTKVVMVDRSRMYIGALNISPRGVELNTENGLLIRDPVLAGQFAAIVARDLEPENAWRVQQDKGGRLYWESSAGKVTRQPADDSLQRFLDWFFGLFPLENQI